MNDKIEEIRISLDGFHFKQPNPNWLTETGIFERIKNLILKQKIVAINLLAHDMIPLEEFDFSVCTSKNAEDYKYQFYMLEAIEKKEAKFANYFQLICNSDSFKILIVTDRLETSMEEIRKCIFSFIDEFKDDCILGPFSNIGLYGAYNYPRLRPPMDYDSLRSYAILNIVDQKYYDTFPEKRRVNKENITNLLKAVKEDGEFEIETVENRFELIKWCEEVNYEKLCKVFEKREELIYKNIKGLDVAWPFNELGDKIVVYVSELENLFNKEYFTYYGKNNEIGFKVYAPEKDTEVDAETAQEIKKALKKGKLNDGRGLKKVVLIVTTRALVLSLDNHAKELGIFRILYIDDATNLWDVRPGGNWKN